MMLPTPSASWTSQWISLLGIFGCVVCGSIAAGSPPPSVTREPSPTPASIERAIAAGEVDQAFKSIANIDESRDSQDWTRALALLANRLESRDPKQAAEVYARSVVAAGKPNADLTADQKSLLRLAAARSLLQVSRPDAVFAVLRPLTQEDQDPKRLGLAGEMLVNVGTKSLEMGDVATARLSFELASKQPLSEDLMATAQLGHAWSFALQPETTSQAIQTLQEFATNYPKHRDAPRALFAAIRCSSDDETKSQQLIQQLLENYPTSDATVQAVTQVSSQDNVPDCIVQWIIHQATSGDSSKVTTQMIATALAASSEAVQSHWQTLAETLAQKDSQGHVTSGLLEALVNQERLAEVERLGVLYIGACPGIQPRCREAACRWAGRSGNWSLLALAARETHPNDESISIPVARLFAESFTQTGEKELALQWWEHLVDTLGETDFSTLLRCAESAVACANVEQAVTRVEAARQASANEPYREALVKLLDADLSIRQLNFDAARSTLEGIVRSIGEIGSLRGRSQWLIGETYFMQRRFTNAIEAYRTVEMLDGGSEWMAPALVQAGKSFEQLGRTQDAAVCYSTLLSRHADSPVAADARRRLATLAPQNETTRQR
jgi:tetratricopeptide (TPR) repeat protein